MRTDHAARSYGRGWLVAVALCGLSLISSAATKLPNIGQVSQGQSSEFATLLAQPMGHAVGTWPPGKMVPGGGWTLAGNYGVAAGTSGAVKVGVDATADVAAKSIGVQVAGSISKADIAGMAVGCVTGTLVGCVASVGIPLATAYFNLSGARVNTGTGVLEMSNQLATIRSGTTYAAQCGGLGMGAPVAQCMIAKANSITNYAQLDQCTLTLSGGTYNARCHYIPNNNFLANATMPSGDLTVSSTWYPTTPQAVKDKLIADAANNPPPLIVPELEKAGVDWNASWKDPQVTGPAEFKSPESVTVKPDGSSTTTQTKTPLSYSGPKVTAGPSVTTSTDRNSGGTTTGTTTTTSTPGNEQPKEEKDPPTQCDKYPDSLGCAELDTPTVEIPKDSKTITYTAETPFGGGSCPADRYFSSGLAGRNFKAVDWVQWCSYAPMIRTLIILLATISAFFIVSLGKDAE